MDDNGSEWCVCMQMLCEDCKNGRCLNPSNTVEKNSISGQPTCPKNPNAEPESIWIARDRENRRRLYA
jgi:hypothetical protein